jgi:hypothetical protein
MTLTITVLKDAQAMQFTVLLVLTVIILITTTGKKNSKPSQFQFLTYRFSGNNKVVFGCHRVCIIAQ